MAPRYKDTHYVAASEMKLLLSLALLVASIVVDIPQAQALTICLNGIDCYVEKPICNKGYVAVHHNEIGCNWTCCNHKA